MKLQNNEYHIGRLLILLHTFASGRRRLDGLTKLAKLDFLLRYPVFLAKLISTLGLDWVSGGQPTAQEELAVESRMIRYKYGPWDDRYYPLLGQMIGMGLVEVSRGRGRVALRLTERGEGIAKSLSGEPEWREVHLRCQTLYKHFNVPGNRLKKLIYESLPEAVDLPLRTEI